MDTFTKEKRSEIMSRIRSKDTGPEIALRKALWSQGFRYRIYYGKEKIDIAFPSKKIAIFIDGCFWHSCPQHSVIPKSNKQYWMPKLKANIERSSSKDKRLIENGWKIIHIWEHELKDIDNVVNRICKIIDRQK